MVLHLAGPAEPLAATARALPFVKEVQALDNKLVIALDNPEADNPALIRQLVGAGAEIQFVGEIRHSLEDRILT